VDRLVRVTTGIEGLDAVLRGGLVRGCSYIIQGRPGAGKTILANQICFHHARTGAGRVLYVTILAESHAHLLQNLSTLSFYDPGLMPEGIYFISGYAVMRDSGLDGLVRLLREEIARAGATMLVLDGLLNVRETAQSGFDLKVFLQQLQGHAEFSGCTTLLLTSAGLDEVAPEHTMVDGVLALSDDLIGVRAIRTISVRKFRGAPHLRGLHQFDILDQGIVVYPRLESLPSVLPTSHTHIPPARTRSGIADLDAMLGGGLPSPSMTLLVGPSGTGKTAFALQFLAQSNREEPGLFFGFYETPPRLESRAAALGFDLSTLVRDGHAEILWQAGTENFLDGLAHRLLTTVRRRKVKRLVIDGFGGFERASVQPSRIEAFFVALSNELRALGVSTLMTWEQREIISPELRPPLSEIFSASENLLLLRYREQKTRMLRILSILKVRDSQFDPGMREVQITDRGILLTDSLREAVNSVTGISTSGAPTT